MKPCRANKKTVKNLIHSITRSVLFHCGSGVRRDLACNEVLAVGRERHRNASLVIPSLSRCPLVAQAGLWVLVIFCWPLPTQGAMNIWEKSEWEGKFGRIIADASFNYSRLSISESGVPSSVAAEAANPTIVNPYSGNRFTAAQIGTFSPADAIEFGEWTLGLKYVFPKIPFFVGGELDVPLGDPSTDDGELGDGYTYSHLLATSGVDYVRYFYGIHYDQWLVKPSFGLHLEYGPPNRRFFLQPTVKFDHVSVDYVKGIEAYENRHTTATIASDDFNLFDVSVKVGLVLKSDETAGLVSPRMLGGFFLYGGPLITDKGGISGWSIGIGGMLGF